MTTASCARSASAYLEQPSTRSDYEAVRATFVALAAGFAALRERIQTYRAAVDSSPVLVGREQEHFADHARTIAEAIATSPGRGRARCRCRDARRGRAHALPARAAGVGSTVRRARARGPGRRGVPAAAATRRLIVRRAVRRRVPQVLLEHLAERVARERIDQLDLLGHFCTASPRLRQCSASAVSESVAPRRAGTTKATRVHRCGRRVQPPPPRRRPPGVGRAPPRPRGPRCSRRCG